MIIKICRWLADGQRYAAYFPRLAALSAHFIVQVKSCHQLQQSKRVYSDPADDSGFPVMFTDDWWFRLFDSYDK